jgi:hypothetical protein
MTEEDIRKILPQTTTPRTTPRIVLKEILNYLKEHPSASMRETSLQLGGGYIHDTF